MQQVISRYKLWIALVLLGVLLFAIWGVMFHKKQASTLQDSVFQHYTQDTANQVNLLIQQQKNASVALALMLSENPKVKQLMMNECCSFDYDLQAIAKRIEQESSITSIWLHAVSRDGISLARSWIDKRGDNLLDVRSDLRAILAQPNQEIATSVSTGLFTMSFKTTVPVFESDVLLGVVEVISQFNPLVNQMADKGYPSLVFADKRYRDQLTLPRSGMFIDDYYLVNTEPVEDWIAILEGIDLAQFLTEQTYLVKENFLINPIPIFNVEKEVEGYWVLFVPTDMINFRQIDDLQSRFMLVSAVVLVMLVLLGLLLLSRQQVALQGQYYKEIIDSASDMLYVSDLDQIIYANGHFFEFFNQFDNLQAFHQQYRCVCDLFEPGEGWLQREMNGVYWIQYVLNHPEVVHKAKIIQDGQVHYFAIKVQPLNQTVFGRYTIAMQDITELELAQTKLVQLSQTDELTNIGNRLFFNKNLAHELARAKRHDLALCIMMFDIDHFKSINDQYGHDTGDKVLKELTLLVKAQLRESDLFCRFGGEEFIVLLPDTDMENAKILTERLLSLIAQHYFDALPSHRITCSFGLTQIQQGDNYNTVLKRVDKALYAAKNGGRNQIQIR